MKLKYNFVTNEVADSIVAVAVGDDMAKFNGFIKMNTTGAEIFGLLREETTAEDVVAKMTQLYSDESPDTVRETVEKFLAELRTYGVVE